VTLRVGVVGATGYAGAELCRLLLAHPSAELVAAFSRGQSGRRLDLLHPALAGCTDLVLREPAPAAFADLDAVFLAVPHGGASEIVRAMPPGPAIFDLSADHRHAEGWVYGQPDWDGKRLDGARRIAVPGCFATAITLSLAPFVGRFAGPPHVAAATGSTGSGASPVDATHHPLRFANLKAYKVLSHQHQPEVETFLRTLGPFPGLRFVPLSAPIDRGILAVCFFALVDRERPDANEEFEVLRRAYHDRALVVVRPEPPELRHVRGTGRAHLSLHVEAETVVVMAAIDNLGKGAAAQAIQCFNRAFALADDVGLRGPAALP
jgi:N-acetyl-gamma-glutamyl-phosphate reductase